MRKIVNTFLAISGLIPALNGNAQNSLGSLSLGSKCPDVVIKNIVNYEDSTVKISDFKGKLLILDFWATWCSPCVAGIPKVDSLRKEFVGEASILGVAYQNEHEVVPFLSKMSKVTGISFPTATGDTILNKLFPRAYIPHFVWIDQTGHLMAITDEEDLTAENIRKIITGKPVDFHYEQDILKRVKMSNPFFTLSNPIESGDTVISEEVKRNRIIWYSALTGYIDGINGYFHEDSVRIAVVNSPIINLYKTAFTGKAEFSIFSLPIPCELQVKDSGIYTDYTAARGYLSGRKCIDWLKQHGFSYEIAVPSTLAWKNFEIMQDELNRYFGHLYGTYGRIIKRKTKCLVLTRTSKTNILTTSGGKPELTDSRYNFHIRNNYLAWLSFRLGYQYMQLSSMPIIDETGITGPVDLEINCDLENLKSLNKALGRYGLKYVIAERGINTLLITDKTSNHN